MGIVIRQSIVNAAITYFGIGLGFVLTIFLYPHILDPDQYGLTRVLISAALISSQFAHLGFHNLILRYFPFFKKAYPEGHGLLFWAFIIPFSGFLVFALLFFLLDDLFISVYSERSPLFADFYLWVLPLTLFVLYFEVLNNYLRSLRDAVSGSFVNEVFQRVLVIALLLLYLFGLMSFSQFIGLFVLSYGLQPVFLTIQIARQGGLDLKPRFDILRKKLLKGMASYSLFSLLGGLTTVMVWNVDVLMLGAMTDLESTAVYAIAFYIGSVIAVPQRSVEKIAGPLISEFIKSKKWDEVAILYKKTSLNQLIPGIFIFGLIWINLELLFQFLPDIYSSGRWVVFIIGLAKLIEVGTGANGIILLNSSHYRVSFYSNVLLVLLTIAANYLLIPTYGIEGAAMASAFAIFVYNSVKSIYILLNIGIQPLTGAAMTALAIGFFLIFILDATGPWIGDSVWFRAIAQSVLFTLFFAAPVLLFRLSEDLNNLVAKFFRTFM
ncbi:lipopolysaccharide biosynthesis protein [Rhodohalobacter mucosus]|uniref:lipopolysaccharide biosynthesis protein n=1 Tax=Rhodohalobacter mucosus TaxID=2079485 RepID=UPI001304BB87|nr:oligosaccharide flippase family protein [Rhodohalobacter mucosus]